MLVTLAALGSALLLAVASVLQHRAGAGDKSLLTVLRHPSWLVGAATGVAGFALHVIALSGGALAVVQPLLVTSLLFALPLGWILEHRRIRGSDLLAGAAVVLGLVLFQLSAKESNGRSSANLTVLAWSVFVMLLVGLAVLIAAARSTRHRAAWLGFGAGAAFGLLAVLLKSSVASLAAGPLAMLSAWPFYAFLLVVAGAIAINQLAFNAGPLAQSLPLITIVDPVVSIAIGVVAFGETVASSPWVVAGQLTGFALMTAGVIALARATAPSEAGLAPVPVTV